MFHNAKFDMEHLQDLGWKLQKKFFYDTMLMFHWLHEDHYSKSLDACSVFYGGKPKNRSQLMQDIINTYGWWAVPADMMAEYAINDAEITSVLLDVMIWDFKLEFPKDDLWLREQKFSNVMMRLERNKVKVDLDFCRQESVKGKLIMKEIRDELGYNPNSNKDLQYLLIEKLGLPVLKRSSKTNAPSFDKETMEQYEEEYLAPSNNPLSTKILRYRGWMKAVSSYYDAYLRLSVDGELRASFKIHGTRTGRLSCERPNLQQIPRAGENEWNKRTKKAFLARPGYRLVEYDYSQLELRLAAAYSKEEHLLEIFEDPDRDVFSEMSEALGWIRDDTKRFVYATLYGGGATRIKNIFGISIQEAMQMRKQFFKAYPKLKRMTDLAKKYATDDGYVEYWTGRRRHFPAGSKVHKAFNAVIQGGGFEIVKDAMIRLDELIESKYGDTVRMVLQVHDSVWFEIKEGVDPHEDIVNAMINMPQDFGVPFVVEAKELHRSEYAEAA